MSLVLGKKVQFPTRKAREAVEKIEKATKKIVIKPNDLVRVPSSDLYDKSSYMQTEVLIFQH